MIYRTITKKLVSMARYFPAVGVIGPRQSGKTTLVRASFPNKPYVSLEDPANREYAINDPRGFLDEYPNGAIIDEIQRVPSLFSYLQGILDEKNTPGLFILTGSQHFLMMENISQTLAGRISLLKLLPFSLEELYKAGFKHDTYEDYVYAGFYPRIYDMNVPVHAWYANYIQTYVERDIRMIKNVHDINAFQIFLKMCASRIGQLLNLSSLADDCGITHNTAKAWLSVLEASFVVFLRRPHYKNFKKRLVKMPKLYFYDTGIACFLLDIQNRKQLTNHALRGNLFESFVISEFVKYRYNQAQEHNFYFWRDKTGHEIDLIISKDDRLIPVEIKSGKTPTEDYFRNILYWNKISGGEAGNSIVIYGGSQKQERSSGKIIPWKYLTKISAKQVPLLA